MSNFTVWYHFNNLNNALIICKKSLFVSYAKSIDRAIRSINIDLCDRSIIDDNVCANGALMDTLNRVYY